MHTCVAIKGEMLGPDDYCEPQKHTRSGRSQLCQERLQYLQRNSEDSPFVMKRRVSVGWLIGRGSFGYRGTGWPWARPGK